MRSAVIAGGTASRFGRKPKGLERVGGERMIDRAVQALQAASGEAPLLVANAPDATRWRPDLTVKKDVLPNCGSLGGIYTALTAGQGPVLVLAWDMPFVTVELLQALVNGVNGHDVFLPEGPGRTGLEPLCAVYAPGAAPAIKQQLEREDFQATGFHADVRIGRLGGADVARFGSGDVLFFNVNTASDLAKAEELWRQQG
jgi:molybdopterin-guanine dinucleotide biosynthesis protein A